MDEIKPEEILMYLRKSRADDPLLSVEDVLLNHESMLDEWGERNLPYPIPKENRIKEVVSGESISDRLGFQQLLKMVEADNIKAVIVKEISRLGRPDKQEIGYISKVFRYTNICVITPTRTFNIADEFERKMFEQELEQGNFYLEYNKRILKAGRDLASKKGAFLCLAPYGYDKTRIDDGKKKLSSLIINEEQASIVKMIFDWYVNENIGTQVISNRLNALGINPPKINIWKPEAIRDIIENPVYIGMVRWNTRKGIWTVVDGEFKKSRPVNKTDDRILTKGLHEAIIPEELFYAAQEKRRRTHRTSANKELKNPFASILYCSCGRAMSYRQKKYSSGINRGEARLVCNAQIVCGSGSCKVSEIESFVVDLLKEKIAEFKIEVDNNNQETITLHDKQIAKLEKTLKELDAREVSMWKAQVDPDIDNRMPTNIFKQLMDDLKSEREKTTQTLEHARNTRPTPIDYKKKIITFQKALDALLDDKVSVAEKNLLLKECIERMIYHREKPEKLKGKGAGRQWIESPISLEIKLNI
jgi:DNA invertase Pin-like site-specific DNA recombinase